MELNEAFRTVREHWEQAMVGTAIYYLNDATKKLGAAMPTPAEYAAGMHSYGEAVPFVYGWKSAGNAI